MCPSALTVSFPVALVTAGFFVVYRLAEDHLLVPRVTAAVQAAKEGKPDQVSMVRAVLRSISPAVVTATPAAPAMRTKNRRAAIQRSPRPTYRILLAGDPGRLALSDRNRPLTSGVWLPRSGLEE